MLNKITIIGNLGNDPETHVFESGGQVTNISVATSRRWKDKQSGEKKEETEWFRVVFFNKLAEIAEEYLTKGSQVYVEGRIQTRKWTDDNGIDRYSTELIATEMKMLGAKNSSSTTPTNSPPAHDAPPQNHHDYNDDIPF